MTNCVNPDKENRTMSMTAIILSFAAWAISFIWLNVSLTRGGMTRGLAMFLSSTGGSIISGIVYYLAEKLFG
ncbi:MAG: hypothetical protein L7F77_15720 [Candidatus Magnetominusculus sp. LBB02]|nr:hypothetical protein [Candidatus Magnetominusculus sp. LBB02]